MKFYYENSSKYKNEMLALENTKSQLKDYIEEKLEIEDFWDDFDEEAFEEGIINAFYELCDREGWVMS